MLNSLFDNKLAKKVDIVAKRKAQICKEEKELTKEFMQTVDRETVMRILDKACAYGHPGEIFQANMLKEKYISGIELEFDDIMTLDALYKSNYNLCSNKGEYDE